MTRFAFVLLGLLSTFAWAEFEDLTPSERLELAALQAHRGSLNRQLSRLAPLWQVGDSAPAFLGQERAAMVQYSDEYFDYKVLRLKFFTDIVYRLATQAAVLRGHNSESLDKMREKYKEFQKNYAVIPTISQLNGADHERGRKDAADFYNSINPAHRDIVDAANSIRYELRKKPSEFWTKVTQPYNNLKSKIKGRVKAEVNEEIIRRIEAERDIFSTAYWYLKTKFEMRGVSLVDENLTAGLRFPLAPNEVNFIVAPHGSREEVAMTAARIARSLPRGEKLAVLLAARWFLSFDENGVRIADAMDASPAWIVVLTETSPFIKLSKEEFERNPNSPLAVTPKSESMPAQVKKAVLAGYKHILVLSEGRLPPYGGGFTNTTQMTFRMPNSIGREKIWVGNEEKRLEPVFTILSGTFSNAHLGYGVSSDPMLLAYETRLDVETTKELSKDPIGFASLVDTLWHTRAYKWNRNRLGSAASEETLLRETFEIYRTIDTANCSHDLLYSLAL